MQGKRMAELSKELLAYLEERGNSEKAQANYRYILNVLTEYSVQHNEGYYSEEILWACVMERYGLTKDGTYRSRTAHHKAKIIRILKMLADFNAGKIPPSRYIQKSEELETPLFQDTVEKYQQHYLKCGYSISGVKNYRREAVKLLRFCETNGRRSFSEISAPLIQDYLLTLEGKAKATIKNALGGMRSFLRYLYLCDLTDKNYGDDIIPLRVKGQRRIPSVWKHDEVLRLLSVIDRGNPSGKRDYVMILIVARLGLRVGDLCRLQFRNIDWKNCRINFVQGKTCYPLSLPLLRDVGWALIDYIRYGRPNVESPYIFLTHVAPFKPFDEGNHHSRMIRKYMSLAHLPYTNTQKCGMHSLRHTLATTMLENHEEYKNITAALGHKSEESASAYLKVSVELLRKCALEIPEVFS